ncbi:MAG: hypothetical protein NWQ57_06135, partial [Paraglaciecola sp.]|nr:hypothetical protein [Paraglaciecola sp.]
MTANKTYKNFVKTHLVRSIASATFGLILLHVSVNASFVLNEVLIQKVLLRYGDAASQRVRDWQELLEDNKASDIPDQLYEVNRFFNRLEFVDDLSHWNKN